MSDSGQADSPMPAPHEGRLAAIQKKVAQRLEQDEAAKVYQLAFWQPDQRAMPTHFIACALFAAIDARDAPQYLDNAEIAAVNGVRIRVKGKRLSQVHADVWLGIMHLARNTPEGTLVRFKAREFLELIGRHDGKSQRLQLHRWITDLVATSVEMVGADTKRRYFGSLVPQGACDDTRGDGEYAVEINRMLCGLFEAGFALMDWNQRQKLRGKWLALWLQHYFSGYQRPVAVAELRRLSGSGAGELREFRRMLKRALGELEAVGGFAAEIGPNDVVIEKTSPRQQLTPAPVAPKPPSSGAQRLLPLPVEPPRVTPGAKARFAKLYPERDAEQCLADFTGWLATKGLTADRPDAAFLGFAKKWADKK